MAAVRTRNWFVELFGRRLGFESNTVFIGEQRYLDRWILYVGGPCIRLHRFWRGDDDRAVHDQPWAFWTFPLTSYKETVEWVTAKGWTRTQETVPRWRISTKRAAKYRHFVIGRADGLDKPFWTIVFAGAHSNKWGFWPGAWTFVYWRFWDAHNKGKDGK